jgi:hypothetical protein
VAIIWATTGLEPEITGSKPLVPNYGGDFVFGIVWFPVVLLALITGALFSLLFLLLFCVLCLWFLSFSVFCPLWYFLLLWVLLIIMLIWCCFLQLWCFSMCAPLLAQLSLSLFHFRLLFILVLASMISYMFVVSFSLPYQYFFVSKKLILSFSQPFVLVECDVECRGLIMFWPLWCVFYQTLIRGF